MSEAWSGGPRSVPPARGFTLIEALVALLVLSFVLTSSILVFFERQKRLQVADVQTRVWQVLSNEAQSVRYTPYDQLLAGQSHPFRSDLGLIGDLGATASRHVTAAEPGLKQVTLEISWDDKSARVEVLRGINHAGELW